MTSDALDALGQQRRDADGRYNAALTALDRAIVTASQLPSLDRAHRELVATALLQFLQQITGFVESKDREIAAIAAERIDQVARGAESLGELRTHIGVLQRATEMLRRTVSQSLVVSHQSAVGSHQSNVVSHQSPVPSPQSPVPSTQSPVPSPQSPVPSPQPSALSPDEQYKYVGFEDAFRGPAAIIEERLRAYVPLFAGRSQVLDIGCGRGELLSALTAAGIAARGIDLNTEMVAVARERGLDASSADALAYLDGLPDESLGGLIATQVIEHLEPPYLMRLIDTAARKLQPGSPIVLETINPACWLAFFSSYIRDFTHVRPVHPDTLQYLLRASGFERVDIRYSAPVPDHVKMKTIDLPAEVIAGSDPSSRAITQIAHTVNANAVILNNLLFTYLDYAAIGYRS